MPGRFATETPIALNHLLHDIAVADGRARKRHAQRIESQLQSEITHLGAHNTAKFDILTQTVAGNDVENFVAVEHIA